MRSLLVPLLLGAILLTIAIVVRTGVLARKNPGEPINAAMRQALAAQHPQLSTADAAIIEQQFPGAHKTDSGLRYIVRARGEGPTPAAGARVTVQYEGRLLDGTKFDSSYDRGQPFSFTVGAGQVIAGWDEALAGMQKGEKRTLIIPYWLAYGEKGFARIPPRATLVFDVELVDFRR